MQDYYRNNRKRIEIFSQNNMIQIKPYVLTDCSCSCGGDYYFSELIWQGLHICERLICKNCNKIRINSLRVNQSAIEPYIFYPVSGLINDPQGNVVADNWFSKKLKSLANPVIRDIEIEIDVIRLCLWSFFPVLAESSKDN